MKRKTITQRRGGVFVQQMKHLAGMTIALAAVILATGCASDRERTAGEAIDDKLTAERVESALSSDPAYKFTEVKVTAFKGTVQLSGFVDKDEQKDRATEIAKHTKGVKDVKNDITRK